MHIVCQNIYEGEKPSALLQCLVIHLFKRADWAQLVRSYSTGCLLVIHLPLVHTQFITLPSPLPWSKDFYYSPLVFYKLFL